MAETDTPPAEAPDVESPPPEIKPPPSGVHKSNVSAVPVPPPAPKVEPPPPPAVPAAEPAASPLPASAEQDKLQAELAALRASIEEARKAAEESKQAIAAQQTQARHERRREFVRKYGGGLQHQDFEKWLPDADPATAEGAQELELWLREHPSVLRHAPPPPMPQKTDAQVQAEKVWGRRPQRTAADLYLRPEAEA